MTFKMTFKMTFNSYSDNKKKKHAPDERKRVMRFRQHARARESARAREQSARREGKSMDGERTRENRNV